MSVRELLDRDRAAAHARLAALSRDLSALLDATGDVPDDEHDPEGTTIGFERAQVVSLIAATRAQLAEIDAAEDRLRTGTFGACERCRRPIADERLRVRPTARRCVACDTRAGG